MSTRSPPLLEGRFRQLAEEGLFLNLAERSILTTPPGGTPPSKGGDL